ncbi:unnamed protein product [Moneuplotes crassus]|uniref:Uncharacterized protein n=1 Tax=Euplotes crassus TaxID=5936 RepID=A0AAD1X3D1_EUPCR|nr:unnamed protein product [Moneuplotes crassus]
MRPIHQMSKVSSNRMSESMDSMMFVEERKNVLAGIQPKFTESKVSKDQSVRRRIEENHNKLKDYRKSGKKRVLRRVERERNGSLSSHSSLESAYITENSIAPSERNIGEESLLEELQPGNLPVRLEEDEPVLPEVSTTKKQDEEPEVSQVQKVAFHAASDAFTCAISNKE